MTGPTGTSDDWLEAGATGHAREAVPMGDHRVDSWRYSYLSRMRLGMGVGGSRTVTRRRCDQHARSCEAWLRLARDAGRPWYNEAPGFTRDRWQLAFPYPDRQAPLFSTKGRERVHGPRVQWRYLLLAMREAWLAEWHRALGTTYETIEHNGGRASAVITGLTT